MVVAANPGTDVTVAPELDLVKAALLYGDTVTLISPVTTMLLGVEALQRFSTHQQIELMRRVAPVLLPADEVSRFEQGVEQIDQFLRTSAKGTGAARILRAGLLQQLQPIQQQLSDAVKGIGHEAGIDELAKARTKGIVQIEDADPGNAMDLLVACIFSAKLAEIGQHHDDSHSERIVTTFVQKLSQYLSTGREYLIFDERVASLTQAAIREGIFTPAKGPAGHSAQAMTASAFMGRLPTFPNATVDEVLDIRTELAPSLTQLRARHGRRPSRTRSTMPGSRAFSQPSRRSTHRFEIVARCPLWQTVSLELQTQVIPDSPSLPQGFSGTWTLLPH